MTKFISKRAPSPEPVPEKVQPTIQDRDFVIATVAAPTIIKEPEKPVEETATESSVEEGSLEKSSLEDGASGSAFASGSSSVLRPPPRA